MSMSKGDDVLNTLGKKQTPDAKEASNIEGSGQQANAGNPVGDAMSDDMTAAAKRSQTGAEGDSEKSQSASGKGEPAEEEVVQDPQSWTKESAFKEIKKLREENKQYRQSYQDKLESLQKQAEEKLSQEKQEKEQLLAAKKELDKIKDLEEDKKRDLSEKLSHREQRIQEMEAKLNQTQQDYESKINEISSKLSEYEAQKEAQNTLNRQKVDNFLEKIPDKHRHFAELIVKGAGDYQDALVALNEAKLSGMFDEKQIVVNHSTPGANNGARSNKEKLDNAAKGERAGMGSSQLIKQALRGIKEGTRNSAFDNKR